MRKYNAYPSTVSMENGKVVIRESITEEMGELRSWNKGWSPAEFKEVSRDKQIIKDIKIFYAKRGGKYGMGKKDMTAKEAEKKIPYLLNHINTNFGNGKGGKVNDTQLNNAIHLFYDYANESVQEYVEDGKAADSYKSMTPGEEVEEAKFNVTKEMKAVRAIDKLLEQAYKGMNKLYSQKNTRALIEVNDGIVEARRGLEKYEANLKDGSVTEAKLEEAPYVASDTAILDSIWTEVKKVLEKELKKGQTELTNIVARIGKYKITKDAQQKGKSFRMDLKR